MRKIAICDDDHQSAAYLKRVIETYSRENSREVLIQLLTEGKQVAEICEREAVDVLFLDIDLPDLSGIEIAENIRHTNQKTMIVFVTAYPDFALQCTKFHTYAYILKPFHETDIYQVLEDMYAMYHGLECFNFITIAIGTGSVKLQYQDIFYISSGRNKVKFVTAEGIYESYTTLKKVLEDLGDEFVRCHQSYIVNLRHIVMRGRTFCLLDNGNRVPVSRNFTVELKQAYAKWSMK